MKNMIFNFEERASDSPFVERIWRTQSERRGAFLSLATSHWEIVLSKYQGETVMTVRGPETLATRLDVTVLGTEFFGIIFKLGTFMPHLPAGDLVDGAVDLPEVAGKSFWLKGSAWQFPNYDNADTFVERLVREGLLACDPVVQAALRECPQLLSPRSVRRRFLRATGLTQGAIRQIERARQAALLLQEGVPILEAVGEAGYADRPHMTRALKHFIGETPAQLVDPGRREHSPFCSRQCRSAEL